MTTTFRGRTACQCLAEWLPVYEQELLDLGVIKHSIDIFQLIGNAKASAGVHAKGGAFDIAQTQPLAIEVARQMGADATWPRMWTNNVHTHGVLRGCPHNGPARYQIDAVDAGYDGTGRGGRGARDTGPRPLSGRTWEQGIAWATARQAARVKAKRQRRFLEALRLAAIAVAANDKAAARLHLRVAATTGALLRKPAAVIKLWRWRGKWTRPKSPAVMPKWLAPSLRNMRRKHSR